MADLSIGTSNRINQTLDGTMKGNKTVEDMDRFLRIAQARLRSTYCFPPQRRAVAARMYREWIEKGSKAEDI